MLRSPRKYSSMWRSIDSGIGFPASRLRILLAADSELRAAADALSESFDSAADPGGDRIFVGAEADGDFVVLEALGAHGEDGAILGIESWEAFDDDLLQLFLDHGV